jgi:hypothetical protein
MTTKPQAAKEAAKCDVIIILKATLAAAAAAAAVQCSKRRNVSPKART